MIIDCHAIYSIFTLCRYGTRSIVLQKWEKLSVSPSRIWDQTIQTCTSFIGQWVIKQVHLFFNNLMTIISNKTFLRKILNSFQKMQKEMLFFPMLITQTLGKRWSFVWNKVSRSQSECPTSTVNNLKESLRTQKSSQLLIKYVYLVTLKIYQVQI